MKPEQLNLLFAPARKWSSRDTIAFLFVAALSCVLLFSGLSARSLWGSEGRWAVAVKEMIASGNYFLPTINGEVYFDKPLLSYWAIIPFTWAGGVSEAATRLPSACAAVGTVLLLFCMGRRLFGLRAGLAVAGLLLTTIMFVLWSRTASAEVLNVFAVWLMLWGFMAGGVEARLGPLLLLFCVGAVSAFLKGPVAPAVGFCAIGFYSLVHFITTARTGRFSGEKVKAAFFLHFRWIASPQGAISLFAGAAVFAFLFLLPVLVTGSWQSAELMWRENVQRFFRPFDHVEPAYVYLKYIPLFFLPWTILLIASLWRSGSWTPNWAVRWTWLTALAIFIFFTASGSRRSYYILPLVPALALITGKTISDWLTKPTASGGEGIVKSAILATAALPGLAGIAIGVAYFTKDLPHQVMQIVMAVFAIIGSVSAFTLLARNRKTHGAIILFAVVFLAEIWAFTGGMSSMEEMRTFRPFCRDAARALEGIPDRKIAFFPGGDSSLVFYLGRGPLKTLRNQAQVAAFFKEYPDGTLIGELRSVDDLRATPGLEETRVILVQARELRGKARDRLALIRLGEG